MKHFRNLWILPVVILWICACSDPLSDKENIVRTLIQGPIASGEYSVFWDGTDDHDNFVEGGTYIALLYARDFTLIDTLNALAGTDGKNNWMASENHAPQLIDEMYNNEPDPFYVEDGTNIRFALSENVSVRLTIQKVKNDRHSP